MYNFYMKVETPPVSEESLSSPSGDPEKLNELNLTTKALLGDVVTKEEVIDYLEKSAMYIHSVGEAIVGGIEANTGSDKYSGFAKEVYFGEGVSGSGSMNILKLVEGLENDTLDNFERRRIIERLQFVASQFELENQNSLGKNGTEPNNTKGLRDFISELEAEQEKVG